MLPQISGGGGRVWKLALWCIWFLVKVRIRGRTYCRGQINPYFPSFFFFLGVGAKLLGEQSDSKVESNSASLPRHTSTEESLRVQTMLNGRRFRGVLQRLFSSSEEISMTSGYPFNFGFFFKCEIGERCRKSLECWGVMMSWSSWRFGRQMTVSVFFPCTFIAILMADFPFSFRCPLSRESKFHTTALWLAESLRESF